MAYKCPECGGTLWRLCSVVCGASSSITGGEMLECRSCYRKWWLIWWPGPKGVGYAPARSCSDGICKDTGTAPVGLMEWLKD